ncbi:MAG: hypothetical protein JWN52_1711 [Actinomycetia bacterium]|jgi:hypothetical protein|nr:hypothetical protein [Actinomycetes bacterium]
MSQPLGGSTTQINDSLRHLELLADDLHASGLRTTLVIPKDRWPYLHIVNPYMRALNDDVIAAPDAVGEWWLWWSWAERITQISDLPRAAARIRQVLAATGER